MLVRGGMDWYIVIKTIKGRRYRYRQKTWRRGTRVRCQSQYISPEIIIGYHGTFAKFERFSVDHLGSANDCDSSREGFFFASNPKVAASYASTQIARQRGLTVRIQTIEARIESMTQMTAYATEEALSEGKMFSQELASKLRNFLAMWERAKGHLNRNAITKVTVSKRAEIKTCVLDMKNPYVHDMEGRRYDDEEFSDAARFAQDSGHDGVIIKRTYDPGSCFGDSDLTNVYIVFDPEKIRGHEQAKKSPAICDGAT
jgi:hypothetical protein